MRSSQSCSGRGVAFGLGGVAFGFGTDAVLFDSPVSRGLGVAGPGVKTGVELAEVIAGTTGPELRNQSDAPTMRSTAHARRIRGRLLLMGSETVLLQISGRVHPPGEVPLTGQK